MEKIFLIAALWLGLAVISAVIAYHLKLSIALVEICVGVAAAAIANHYFGMDALGNDHEWLKFLASSGAVLLTFLAGAELDPKVIKTKLVEVSVVGLIGFLAPFIGGAAAAYFLLHWDPKASLLAGIALSTTSMAVVYAVMLETGFNKTDYGKGILGSCFVNDVFTVLALGFIFAPFTVKTVIFIVVVAVTLAALPFITKFLSRMYGNRTAEIRSKWIVFVLFGLGALAVWAGSEAVLPAYLVGIILAEFTGGDHAWIKRFRTLTTGFLTPFYFLRAGSLVSIPGLLAAPMVLVVLFTSKVISKIFGLFPIIGLFRKKTDEKWYYTLLMSTGLTFGTISALYGFSHGIVSKEQYSFLVTAVIASAVVPTMIAGIFFTPKHLLAHAHKSAGDGAQEE